MNREPGTNVGCKKHSECMLKNFIHYRKVVPHIIAAVLNSLIVELFPPQENNRYSVVAITFQNKITATHIKVYDKRFLP